MNLDKENTEANQTPVTPRGSRSTIGLSMGTAIGISLGIIIGILTNNRGLWLPLGIIFGISLGAAFDRAKERSGKPKV